MTENLQDTIKGKHKQQRKKKINGTKLSNPSTCLLGKAFRKTMSFTINRSQTPNMILNQELCQRNFLEFPPIYTHHRVAYGFMLYS